MYFDFGDPKGMKRKLEMVSTLQISLLKQLNVVLEAKTESNKCYVLKEERRLGRIKDD